MGTLKKSMMYYIIKSGVVKSDSASYVSSFSKWSVNEKPLRCYDATEKKLTHSPLRKVLTYGEDRLYKIRTEDDYEGVFTGDTLILTADGWMPVIDLTTDDTIMENGMEKPPYQDKETLKRLYVDKGMTQQEIADMYSASPRTIRAWVDRFELHRGDAGALFGEDNPAWKGDDVSRKGAYGRTHNKMDAERGNVCQRCGAVGDVHIHHRDRIVDDIEDDNLEILCPMCHKAEHHGAVIRWIRPARITDIEFGGYDKTIGFTTDMGNVVVDGFIVSFPEDGASIKEIGDTQCHTQVGKRDW